MRLLIHEVYFWLLADIVCCVRNPPQADLITAAMYVVNLAQPAKLDERGRIAVAAIAIVAWQDRLSILDAARFLFGGRL